MGFLRAGIGGALGGAAIGGAIGGANKHPWEDYSGEIAEGAMWGAGVGAVGTMGAWGLGRKALGATKKGAAAAERGLNKAAGVVPEDELITPYGKELFAKGARRAEKRRRRVIRGAQKRHRKMAGDWKAQANFLNKRRGDRGAIGNAKRRAKAYGRLWRRRRRQKMEKEMNFPPAPEASQGGAPSPTGGAVYPTAEAEMGFFGSPLPLAKMQVPGGASSPLSGLPIKSNPIQFPGFSSMPPSGGAAPIARAMDNPASAPLQGGYGPANPISKGEQVRMRLRDIERMGRL